MVRAVEITKAVRLSDLPIPSQIERLLVEDLSGSSLNEKLEGLFRTSYSFLGELDPKDLVRVIGKWRKENPQGSYFDDARVGDLYATVELPRIKDERACPRGHSIKIYDQAERTRCGQTDLQIGWEGETVEMMYDEEADMKKRIYLPDMLNPSYKQVNVMDVCYAILQEPLSAPISLYAVIRRVAKEQEKALENHSVPIYLARGSLVTAYVAKWAQQSSNPSLFDGSF